jgi:hypothetical protein
VRWYGLVPIQRKGLAADGLVAEAADLLMPRWLANLLGGYRGAVRRTLIAFIYEGG